MATKAFYRIGMVCSICAFILMFIAFASPYWYKSWTRVHSPFANIGLWHVCLSGWMMPRDPVMKSYVGCWWIHSTEFELVANEIMPVWFRVIQFFCVCTVGLDLVAMVLTLIYLLDSARKNVFDKDRGRMFIFISLIMLGSAFIVFLIALIFAEMSNDGSWMPRPWMNYLSWSYGFCVLSGFFSAFGGMVLFILGLVYKDKDRQEVHDLPDSAADMRRQREEEARRAREKEEEAMAPRHLGPSQVPQTRFAPPHGSQEMIHRGPYGSQEILGRGAYPPPVASRSYGSQELLQRTGYPPPVAAKPAPKVGESFV